MLRAVEAWRSDHDLAADFRTWESWYAHISDRITKVAGVRAEVNGPIRGGPFPTLKFCPTGGVTAETATTFLSLPNVVCVGGSWLTPKAALAAQNWAEVTRLARAASQLAAPAH